MQHVTVIGYNTGNATPTLLWLCSVIGFNRRIATVAATKGMSPLNPSFSFAILSDSMFVVFCAFRNHLKTNTFTYISPNVWRPCLEVATLTSPTHPLVKSWSQCLYAEISKATTAKSICGKMIQKFSFSAYCQPTDRLTNRQSDRQTGRRIDGRRKTLDAMIINNYPTTSQSYDRPIPAPR